MDNYKPYKELVNNLQNIEANQDTMQPGSCNQPPPCYSQPNTSQPNTSQPTVNIMPVSAPAAVFPQPVGPKSMEMTCPSCRSRITTTVRHQANTKTHIACILLSWTCCCCCLPYCMDSCRNANHFCPMCGAFIGTYAS